MNNILLGILFLALLSYLSYWCWCEREGRYAVDDFAIIGGQCSIYDGNIENRANLGNSCVYNIQTDECLSIFDDIYLSTYPYFDWNYWYAYNNYFPFYYSSGNYYLNNGISRRYPHKYGHIRSGIRSHRGNKLYSRDRHFRNYDRTGRSLFNNRSNILSGAGRTGTGRTGTGRTGVSGHSGFRSGSGVGRSRR